MVQYFTEKSLKKLKEELYELKTKKTKEIAEMLKYAASFGDLKENAGYDEAKDRQAFLLGRIEQLEFAINDAVVVEKKEGVGIQVGSEILILFGGKKEKYHIVAPGEADILKNKLSYQSPLGQQLIGKKSGEEFNYEIRDKKIKVKILEIE